MRKTRAGDVEKAGTHDHEPLFAICGRPNVGKSTLFNKLTETRRSIVGDEPGITRDRIYGEVRWDGRVARIVDTGGMVPDDEALIPSEIHRQARVALDEAEVIVMVVDGRTELASPDYDLAKYLLRGGKPVMLAVNKIDTEQMTAAAENYRRLGFKTIFPISAEHSLGIGDLLDAVFEALPIAEPPAETRSRDPRCSARRRPEPRPSPHPRRIRAVRDQGRHHWPTQRRQIHAAQCADRNQPRHRLAHRRNHP